MEQSRVLAALSALAHEVRLDIVRLLAQSGAQGMCAGRISKALDMSASGLSFHLSALDRAGLITATREGRHVRYVLNRAQMGGVFRYVLSDCCCGDPEIRDHFMRPAGCQDLPDLS